MFARPGLCGMGIGRLGLMAASQPSLVTQALAILAKYGSAANLYLPGVGAISGIQAGNWLDTVGTTAATVDNPVGLVVSAGKAVGPELITVNSVTGLPSGGGTRYYSLSSAMPTVVVGNTYRVSYTVSGYSGSGNVGIAGTNSFSQVVHTGNGSYQSVHTPNGTAGLVFYTSDTNTCKFSNISVRELPGARLTQSTAANRPVLRRGLVNLVFSSGDMSSASWTAGKSSGATVGSWTTGPDGQQSARLVTYSTASEYLYQGLASYPAVTGQSVTLAFVCNTATRAGGFGGATPSGTDVFTAYDMGGGWWLQTTVRTFTVTTSANALQLLPGSVFGLGAATVAYHRAALYQGTVTAQQIIDSGGIPLTTTAPASSTKGPFAWQLDGSNDSFSSTLATGNEGWVCTSAKPSVMGNQILITNGANLANQPGISLKARTNGEVWINRSNGSAIDVLVFGGTSSLVAGVTKVVDAAWTATGAVGAINGVEVTRSTNMSAASSVPLRISGSIDATPSEIFYGTIGATIIMPTVLPTVSERATLRQFIASLSGVTM